MTFYDLFLRCCRTCSNAILAFSLFLLTAHADSQVFSTPTIRILGSENLGKLLSLEMPESAIRAELESLRGEFLTALELNMEFISDSAILLAEALSLKNAESAKKLLSRHDQELLPESLRDHLSLDHVRKLRALALMDLQKAPLTRLRLHPFWWSTPGCAVALDGRFLAPRAEKLALEGEEFFLQRICKEPHQNRLARGRIPLGREVVFIAFQGDPSAPANGDSQSVASDDRPKPDHMSYGALVEAAWGRFGAAQLPMSRGHRPSLRYGLSIGTAHCWAIKVAAGQLPRKRLDLRSQEHLLMEAGLSKCHSFTFKSLSVEPNLGAGMIAVSPGTGLLTRSRYLAPNVTAGLSFFWEAQTLPIRIGMAATVGASPPPWKSQTLKGGLVFELLDP